MKIKLSITVTLGSNDDESKLLGCIGRVIHKDVIISNRSISTNDQFVFVLKDVTINQESEKTIEKKILDALNEIKIYDCLIDLSTQIIENLRAKMKDPLYWGLAGVSSVGAIFSILEYLKPPVF